MQGLFNFETSRSQVVERTTFNLLGHGFIYYLVLGIFLLSLYLLSCVSFIRIFVVVVNAFLIFKTSHIWYIYEPIITQSLDDFTDAVPTQLLSSEDGNLLTVSVERD